MTPLLITSDNLSAAWSRMFLHIVDHPGTQISPLLLSITGFDGQRQPAEDGVVRAALDTVLAELDAFNVEDVAYTIFPQRLWEMAKGSRQTLYQFYKWAFPAYQAANRALNRKGLYFERLVQYGRGPKAGNQLEWILSQYEQRHDVRRSMLQASIFDPERDHVPEAQTGFPCLQQVSFVPTDDGLVVNAFYATQQALRRAYGNCLGLAQLGAFMAHEMKLPLAQLNVTAGIEKMDGKGEGKTNPLLSNLKAAARACIAAEDARRAGATPAEKGIARRVAVA